MATLVIVFLLSLNSGPHKLHEVELNTYWSQSGEWRTQILARNSEEKVVDWTWYTEDYTITKVPGQQKYLVFRKGIKLFEAKHRSITQTKSDPERNCATRNGMDHRITIFRTKL